MPRQARPRPPSTETSISDVSSGAKQNFPQDPISTSIGGAGGAAHSSHGAASYGGAPLATSTQDFRN